MTDLSDRIRRFLEDSGFDFEIVECDPEHAETAVFSELYGYSLEDSANAILVRSKTGPEKLALCLVLATCRLDVNKVIRKRLGARKASFAGPEETRRVTGMELGGVQPFCMPEDLPIWIDARIMTRERIVLGGGDRSSKIVVDPAVLCTLTQAEVIDGLAIEVA